MNRKTYLFLFLAIFNVVFHLLFYKNLEFHRDEMFYYVYGKHPAAGYATTPPLLGLISFLLIKIAGFSLFAVRFVPALFSGIMVFIVAKMIKELGGTTPARIMGTVAFILAPFAMRTYFLYMPVFLDVFFWSLALLFLLRYFNRNEPADLIWLGITGGLGMLNKYLIALLFFLILVFILFTKHKKIYTRKHFYFGILAGLILFMPNLVWQIRMGLPVIHHMAELDRTQLAHVNRIDFLVDQLTMPFPSTLFTVAGIIFLLTSKKMKEYRVTGWITLFVIIILMTVRGKSYYTLGVFPFLIAAGSVFWDSLLRRNYLKISFMALLLLIAWFILPINLPVYKPEGLVWYFREMEDKTGMTVGRRFEDGTIHSLPQDYADMIGWNELVEVTSKTYNAITDKEATLIYCENYGQASAIEVLGSKLGLPVPFSFNDSYLYWLHVPLKTEITTLIYINDEPGDDIRELFADIEKTGQITNINSREFGTSVYLCRNPRRSFNQFWNTSVQAVREKVKQ